MKPLGHCAVVCLVAALAMAACSRDSDTRAKPTTPTPSDSKDPAMTDPPSTSSKAEWAAVYLTDQDGKEHKVKVEVVRTPRAIRRGLMYRQHMAADNGMLFFMGREEIQSFWMRNTLIPLDMLFIRRDLTVAGIVKNAEPLTETSRSIDKPSLYVLEVNGGWTTEHRIAAGARVRFEGVSPQAN